MYILIWKIIICDITLGEIDPTRHCEQRFFFFKEWRFFFFFYSLRGFPLIEVWYLNRGSMIAPESDLAAVVERSDDLHKSRVARFYCRIFFVFLFFNLFTSSTYPVVIVEWSNSLANRCLGVDFYFFFFFSLIFYQPL